MKPLRRLAVLGAAMGALAGTINAAQAASAVPPDPLRSVMWEDMAERFFSGGPIRFDGRVKVLAPASAEDPFFVPVTVDARALNGVEEIVVVVDLNPIPHVLTFRPTRAEPFIGFRVKLQQASAVHAGVRLSDGSWAVGGVLVDAAGGGCTAPAQAYAASDWMQRLGETRGTALREGDGAARMSFRIRHPMDTGLAPGIPAFYMNELTVLSGNGEPVAALEMFEPVSENPTLTILPRIADADKRLDVRAGDTEGNRFAFGLDLSPAPGN